MCDDSRMSWLVNCAHKLSSLFAGLAMNSYYAWGLFTPVKKGGLPDCVAIVTIYA